ncbi:MAG: phage major capsid protein [Gemmatimonadetes bacterium]|nr:phage major capsid protein [Gemmatimonadota bacterium]
MIRKTGWTVLALGLCIGLAWTLGHYLGTAGHLVGALAVAAPVTARPLATILDELKKLQDEYTGKAMPEDVGKKFEDLAGEARAIQDEADRGKRIAEFERFGREVPDPALPAEPGKGAPTGDDEIVGYVSLGRGFVESAEYKTFLENRSPQGSLPYVVKGLRQPLVPVTRAQLKAIPTLGADVIAPQRVADVVRSAEMRRMTIESLLPNETTSSSSVEYVTVTPGASAAAMVAEAAAKPEAATTLGTATAPVRTLAVWMPVTEQMLQDVGQIQGMIDNELRYDLSLVKEKEMTWGAGTGQHFLGIFNTPSVAAGRTVGGDTLLDKIRRAITDVSVAELMATGVVIHPYDSETLDLLKGTDSRYVWAVVTDANGGKRVWGLDKVESQSMQKPTIGGSNTTYERRVLVGDFQRGASLWQRQQANVAVGYINTDFTQNQRTIRAEERAAFGVKRPLAFRYVVAQAEAA